MNNIQRSAAYLSRSERATFRAGFTLIEVLVATVLTLIIMAATVTLFASVTEGIAASRGIIETVDRLRGTQERLILDLRGVTALMLPPLRPEWGLGYFEYVEGAGTAASPAPTPVDAYGQTESSVGDRDDVLMFTTRSTTEPFIGGHTFKRAPTGGETRDGNDDPNQAPSGNYKLQSVTFQSPVAEVAWFVRGTTLYRRVLLVAPHRAIQDNDTRNPAFSGFCQYDLSVRQVGGAYELDDGMPTVGVLVPNSLADLTKRENRYAHQPRKLPAGTPALYGYPFGIARWGSLGLPLLQECSDPTWPFPWYQDNASNPVPVTNATPFATPASTDYWGATNPPNTNPITQVLNGYPNGTRIAEDVILTNVIGFDVRIFDPGAPVIGLPLAGPSVIVTVPGDADFPATIAAADIDGFGAYVDLGWNASGAYSPASVAPTVVFGGTGLVASLPQVYDTWSTHYECDGINQDSDGVTDEGTDGLDNDSTNGIDDPVEQEASPPYPYPLRGIQIKIRVFEPDSRQIREVTVVQDFLPE